MDSSFYTLVGEGKYEVHFETGEKWKYVLVEAACREAIGRGKAFMVTENIVRCGECRYRITAHGISDGWVLCSKPYTERGNAMHRADWFCADGGREVQE